MFVAKPVPQLLMTDDEYLEFVEQFLESFRDLEPRRPIAMDLALL